MRVIVGLGNPGSKYADTRHNFGFWILDAFAKDRGMGFKPGKGDYLVAQRPGKDWALIKPTSFMNDSGIPVQAALQHLEADIAEMLIVYDDIDIPLGRLRFRARGGAGGHRGVESVIYHLNSDVFPRLKVGIETDAPLRPSERYVLEPFRGQDQPLVEETIVRAVEGLNHLLIHGIDKTMGMFNAPKEESTPDIGEV
ncbi:MAG: aminoacyl-tRNA hydrolase [Gammaproteobacteria bacterium]